MQQLPGPHGSPQFTGTLERLKAAAAGACPASFRELVASSAATIAYSRPEGDALVRELCRILAADSPTARSYHSVVLTVFSAAMEQLDSRRRVEISTLFNEVAAVAKSVQFDRYSRSLLCVQSPTDSRNSDDRHLASLEFFEDPRRIVWAIEQITFNVEADLLLGRATVARARIERFLPKCLEIGVNLDNLFGSIYSARLNEMVQCWARYEPQMILTVLSHSADRWGGESTEDRARWNVCVELCSVQIFRRPPAELAYCLLQAFDYGTGESSFAARMLQRHSEYAAPLLFREAHATHDAVRQRTLFEVLANCGERGFNEILKQVDAPRSYFESAVVALSIMSARKEAREYLLNPRHFRSLDAFIKRASEHRNAKLRSFAFKFSKMYQCN